MSLILKSELPLVKMPFSISPSTRIALIGSCFSENIGQCLQDHYFETLINPHGILYNPQSILDLVTRAINNTPIEEKEFFENTGIWRHWHMHSQMAKASLSESKALVNEATNTLHHFLKDCDFLFLTLGSAIVYRLNETGKIVGNCHKIPASKFRREYISTHETIKILNEIVDKIKAFNPSIEIVFTVSPVRHLKEGMIDNQRSKSILLGAIHECIKNGKGHYFPSYELMMDDLRDYRFYKEDLVHPSDLAIKYIWQYFQKACLTQASLAYVEASAKINTAINHKPFNPSSDDHQKFLGTTLTKINDFEKKYGKDLSRQKTKIQDQIIR